VYRNSVRALTILTKMPGKASQGQKRKAYANMTAGGMSAAKAKEILQMYMGGMTMPAAMKKAMGGATKVPKAKYGKKTAMMKKGGKTASKRRK